MPKASTAVVVTRPRGRGASLAAALRARGLRPVFAPLIRTVPPRSWAALDRALRRLDLYDAAAFASAAAVEAFFARARRVLGRAPRRPLVVGAVGPATAAALAARGWKADLIPEEGTGRGLGRAMCLARNARVLLPRAEKGRPELPRLLRKAGARLTVVTAYRTVADAAGAAALKAALDAGASCVSFASGSAVEQARKTLGAGRLRRVRAVAIGPSTERALRARGVVPAATARAPDAEALAEACARALR
ncbi:MAG: uroporphyrinogen-III synthase [Elusimicrobiota bacterium]|nr:uroporphyrinogen-III synthase [Elusimicrobiota bacterium]